MLKTFLVLIVAKMLNVREFKSLGKKSVEWVMVAFFLLFLPTQN